MAGSDPQNPSDPKDSSDPTNPGESDTPDAENLTGGTDSATEGSSSAPSSSPVGADATATGPSASVDDESDPDGPGRSERGQRVLIALAGVILLLLGVGVGLVIAASYSDDDAVADDRPAADSAAVGFAQDMIRHHEQGVEMAAIELTNGTDPQVRSMAFDILTTQSNEIGQMQSWLSRWGYPVINPDSPMAWMSMSGGGTSGDDHDHADGDHAGHDHGTHDHGAAGHDEADDHDHGTGDHGTGDQQGASGGHGASDDHGDMPGMAEPSAPGAPAAGGSTSGSADEPPMPGMATAADMDRFRTLRGRDADVDFLQLMLRHHEGGLHMMEYAANPANVTEPYVRDLASAMLRTQNKEIGIITAMLAERGAQPLPMN